MATIIAAGASSSASVVVDACRSGRSLQQQQNPMNVLCSSSQVCKQGGFPGGSVKSVGLFDTTNHPQVSHFLKSKNRLRLRATARAEFQAVLAEDATEAVSVPDTRSSSEAFSSPEEIPGTSEFVIPQIEDGSLQGQEGIPDTESSSTLTFEDVPATSPPVNDVPSFLDAADSSPSTSAPAVDAFQDGPVDKAALSAQEEYLRLIGGNKPQVQTDDLDGFGDSLKGAADGINSARDAVAKSLEDVVNAVRDSVDSAGRSVKNAYDSLNGSIVRAIQPVTAPFKKTVDDVQSSVVDNAEGVATDFTSIFRVGTPANDALNGIVIVVKNATGSALGAAGSVISQGYSTTKDNVPPEVQSFFNSAEDKVVQITGPVGSTINQAYVIITDAERAVGLNPDNPVIPVILVVGGSLFLGFAFFNIRYGGYSGDLSPSEALDVLKKENAVLVDIRTQKTKEAEGIPDLRRSTRSKFAAVEAVKVEGAVRGMLKNISDVESLLTAAIIRNLKNVNGGAKILVLDSDGGQSKRIAKGLKKSGAKRPYRVDGGFKAWESLGLPVKPEGPQSALTVLQEAAHSASSDDDHVEALPQDAEAIVEEVKPTSSGVSAVVLGSVAGVYALYEWEKTLQLIAVLGIATSIYSRVSSYGSAEDAKADLKLLQKPFTLVIQGVVSIAGLVEPKKLQLATSPVSSNVQGRVMQAAAKHGPQPSELELVEEEPNEIPVAEPQEGGEVEGSQSQHTSAQDAE